MDYFMESGEPWQTPESDAPLLVERLTAEDRAKYSQEYIDRLAAIDALREANKVGMLALEERLRKERQGSWTSTTPRGTPSTRSIKMLMRRRRRKSRRFRGLCVLAVEGSGEVS